MADREKIVDAITKRNQKPPSASNSSTSDPVRGDVFSKGHERKQEFRRLVDPGMTRPNSREVVSEAIKTLLLLAGNIIDHPEEKKYRRFKPTNQAIKRAIVDPKGTLEYAVQLGFQPEIENFQPYYVFKESKSHWEDLRIGYDVLREFGDREAEREVREAKVKAEEKAVVEAQKEKMRLAFLDDRKSKRDRDERERQLRSARAAKQPSTEPEKEPTPPPMPGSGHCLSEPETFSTLTGALDE